MIDHCPKCKSPERVKNGHIRGRARYRCKNCKYDYTVMQKSTAIAAETKRLALAMYLEGLGFNSIGRILKVSHVSVMNWVKKYGKQAEELRSEKAVEVAEMDEMHTYVGSKKTTFGSGLLLTGTANGSSILFLAKGTGRPAKNSGQK
ncbi:MAG: IS1 family transposase [Chitinophagaceae bacterium]